MRTPVGRTGAEHWETVIPHRRDVLLQYVELFRDHLVLSEREGGLTRLRVRPWEGEEHYIAFDEPAYLAYLSANREVDTNVLRFGYTSLSAPSAVYDYDMTTRERTLLKEDEVLGGYDRARYVVERLHAPARDGRVEVPVSLVYRRGLEKDGDNPLLLSAYGAYGYAMDATFSSPRVSLLDRGFVYAIAHVRGGQELGRAWYDDGKMFNKKNTFTDFIDVAGYLVDNGYTSPEKLFAAGGSAGGLLMGAVTNMRPELFRGVVAHVPFVDVVTTMLDTSIPLTTFEFDEWGNPAERESYEYMLSYSPYDQVEATAYPNTVALAVASPVCSKARRCGGADVANSSGSAGWPAPVGLSEHRGACAGVSDLGRSRGVGIVRSGKPSAARPACRGDGVLRRGAGVCFRSVSAREVLRCLMEGLRWVSSDAGAAGVGEVIDFAREDALGVGAVRGAARCPGGAGGGLGDARGVVSRAAPGGVRRLDAERAGRGDEPGGVRRARGVAWPRSLPAGADSGPGGGGHAGGVCLAGGRV